MSRFARTACMAALTTALCFSVPAAARSGLPSNLDPARLFDRNAETMISLVPARREATKFSAALFNVAVTDSQALQPPVVVNAAAEPAHLTLPEKNAPEQTISAQAFATSAPLYADDGPLLAPTVDQRDAISLPAIAKTFVQAPSVRFGAYQPYVPTLQTAGAQLNVPLRIGGVHFTGQLLSWGMQSLHPDAFHIMQVCGTTDIAAPCPYVSDTRAQSFIASTNFTLRAGNDHLALQLTGGVEHIGFDQNAAFPYVPASPDLLGNGERTGSFDPQAPLLYYPGLTNVVKQSVGAKLAVPVTPRVTVGLQYETQKYKGDYGTLLFPGLDARKDTYLGNVTYQLPYSSSAITLSARQYRYQDAPDFNLTQTRADLNFTVKF